MHPWSFNGAYMARFRFDPFKLFFLITLDHPIHPCMNTVEDYIAALPPQRQEIIEKMRVILHAHMPKGFEECIQYKMITYVVPKTIYPNGYHCDPTLPLPFVSLASQKNFVALYHMGIYSDPDMLRWFQEEYPKVCHSKLDMGKSCIRFKKTEDIPFELIGALMKKMTVSDWIERYEMLYLKKK